MTRFALTRTVSPSLRNCELAHLERQPVDVARARRQHRAYQQCLVDLGLELIPLPAEPELPDAVFVEDTAVVVDEVAVVARTGAQSRRAEVESVKRVLTQHRQIECITAPGTLDGGDVVVSNRTILVGLSSRTNREGVAQLSDYLESFGYRMRVVPVDGCTHLKSACCDLGDGTLLVNPAWIDTATLDGFDLVAVPGSESWAVNTVRVGKTIVMAAGCPETQEQLETAGWAVRALDISEFQKAEGGVSCLSLIFESTDNDTR